MWEVLALSFGLAMDATAVAAARGLTARRNEIIVLPLLFGVFQSGMAALGWLAGAWGGPYFAAYNHWVAFGLLFLIGGKMLIEALRGGEDAEEDRSGLGTYLMLAFATSIDAAAAGITLPLLEVSPAVALALIGVVTFACSFAGHWLGRVAGKHLGQGLEILGGLVLIAIGVRVLVLNL